MLDKYEMQRLIGLKKKNLDNAVRNYPKYKSIECIYKTPFYNFMDDILPPDYLNKKDTLEHDTLMRKFNIDYDENMKWASDIKHLTSSFNILKARCKK